MSAPPICMIHVTNETGTNLTLVETSPNDPQHVDVPKGGGKGHLGIADTASGNIHLVACTGYLGSWICTAGRYFVEGRQLGAQIPITNKDSEPVRCWVASGGGMREFYVPAGKTELMYTAATGFIKVVVCEESGSINAMSEPIPWNGSTPLEVDVTAVGSGDEIHLEVTNIDVAEDARRARPRRPRRR